MGAADGTVARFVHPDPVTPGSRVAVVSPSSGLPDVFPAPFELGLRRLRAEFALEPVEYPTTRRMGASLGARAADLHAAFADPGIAAVITSIGGDDQLKLLGHLDRDLLREHPTPFFGWSDSTNLLHLLWGLGIVGYHGGAVMVQLGRPGALHPVTAASLHRALFTRGRYDLPMPTAWTDEDRDWSDPAGLRDEPTLRPAWPWSWHGPGSPVTGPAWGGNLEVIDFQLRAGRWLLDPDAYEGAVLFIETSEELPDATYVYRVLMGMGERGLLGRFAAVLVGRAKAWSFERPDPLAARAAYARRQRDAVLRALDEYNPRAVVVLDVDFGHTDPQLVIPHGGAVTVSPPDRRITVTY